MVILTLFFFDNYRGIEALLTWESISFLDEGKSKIIYCDQNERGKKQSKLTNKNEQFKTKTNAFSKVKKAIVKLRFD